MPKVFTRTGVKNEYQLNPQATVVLQAITILKKANTSEWCEKCIELGIKGKNDQPVKQPVKKIIDWYKPLLKQLGLIEAHEQPKAKIEVTVEKVIKKDKKHPVDASPRRARATGRSKKQ